MNYKKILDARKRRAGKIHKISYIEIFRENHSLIVSSISLVSIICYFIYFGLFVDYFPVLSGSEIIYVGALLFTIVAILSLFIVSIILLYGWYYIRANNQPTFSNNWLAMILAIPLTLILVKYLNKVISIFLKEQYDIFNNKLLFFIFFFLISFCLFSLLLKIPNWLKNSFIKFPLLLKIPNWLKNSFIKNLIYIILIISAIIGLICLVEFIIKTNGCVQLCLVSLLYMCILVLIFLFTKYIYKDKKPATYVSIVTVMLFIIIFNYCSDDIAKKFEITNVEYKYLSIDKSALDALPKEINDISEITPFEGQEAFSYIKNNLSIIDSNKKDQNISISISPKYLSFSCANGQCKDMDKATGIKFQNNVLNYCIDKNCTEENATIKIKQKEHITYIEKYGDTIWLHNIKALSTLGKFYYLETKDGVKFELDSSKIISKAKEQNP